MSIGVRAGVVVLQAALASTVLAAAIQQPQVPSTDTERTTSVGPSATGTGPPVSKPFQQLFTVQAATQPDPLHFQDRLRGQLRFLQESAAQPAPPRTVCGLTVWNIDPALDARMRLKPPQPPNVTYAIQKLTPPVCQE